MYCPAATQLNYLVSGNQGRSAKMWKSNNGSDFKYYEIHSKVTIVQIIYQLAYPVVTRTQNPVLVIIE